MGSGKGYLSAHLALQHNLMVLGVDAQNTNTDGATKRAGVLTKQWKGLTRNARLRGEVGEGKKLGKRLKKKMRKLEEKGMEIVKKEAEKVEEVCEDVLADLGDIFTGLTSVDDGSVTGEDCGYRDTESGADIYKSDRDGEVVIKTASANSLDQCKERLPVNDSSNYVEFNKSDTPISNSRSQKFCEKTSEDSKTTDTKLISKKKKNTIKCKNHFPVTLYVRSDTDLIQVLKDTLSASCDQTSESITRESTLMLTGLHTCGGLGSSTMRLFVNCPQVSLLCNVGCCYHLMDEEFVANPYEQGTVNHVIFM